MTKKEVLVKARALITKPENWTTGTLCKGRNEGDKFVVSYCAIGAMKKAAGLTVSTGEYEALGNQPYTQAVELLGSVVAPATPTCRTPYSQIPSYNDTRGHKCVLEAFDAAIEKCDEETAA